MPPPKKRGEATTAAPLGFEEVLDRLERLVERLEAGDLPLETAVTLFEEGMSLAKLGSQRLEEAELKVEELLADPKGTQTRPLLKSDTAGKT